jgi:hypothetical protein
MFNIWFGAPCSIPSFTKFTVPKKDLEEYTGRYYNKENDVAMTIARYCIQFNTFLSKKITVTLHGNSIKL